MPDNPKPLITYRRWFLEELFDAVADIAETEEHARCGVAQARRDAVQRVVRAAGVTLGALLDGALNAPMPSTLRPCEPLDDENRCDGCGAALGEDELVTFVRVAVYRGGSRRDVVDAGVCAACAAKLAPAITTLCDAFAARCPAAAGEVSRDV